MLRSLVSIRIQVYFTPRQGCFSPFPLGTLRYRSSDMFSLGPWSARIQPEFLVLRPTQGPCSDRLNPFAYGALTLSGWLSQHHSTRLSAWHWHGLGSSPFAHHYLGYLFDFFSIRLLRCFTSPTSPPLLRVPGLRQGGSPIRTPPDQRSLASPRSISPLAASFFAVRCLGILRMPLFLCSPIHLCLLFRCQYTQGKLRARYRGSAINAKPFTSTPRF